MSTLPLSGGKYRFLSSIPLSRLSVKLSCFLFVFCIEQKSNLGLFIGSYLQLKMAMVRHIGAIHVLYNAIGAGVIRISSDQCYKGAWYNTISIVSRLVADKLPEKALHNTSMAPYLKIIPCRLSFKSWMGKDVARICASNQSDAKAHCVPAIHI